MRTILFRGKRVDNGEWVEGWLLKVKAGNICSIVREADTLSSNGYETYPVIPETVGQYTGLNDKNGKMIFEWDIVECGKRRKKSRRIVTWRVNGNFVGFNVPRRWIEQGMYEVVGNIHDNPELLSK